MISLEVSHLGAHENAQGVFSQFSLLQGPQAFLGSALAPILAFVVARTGFATT
jgi:hypothetical protein